MDQSTYDLSEVETFVVDLAIEHVESMEGQPVVQYDKLVDAIISNLRSEVADLDSQVDLLQSERDAARTSSGKMAADNFSLQAKLAAAQTRLGELEARMTTSEEAEALRVAGAMLGERLAQAEAELEQLKARQVVLLDAEARAGAHMASAADLSARLAHAESQIKLLREEKATQKLRLTEASGRLAAASERLQVIETELRHANEALARADKAKLNALASQAASYEERLRAAAVASSEAVSLASTEELNRLKAQLDDLNQRNADLELAKQGMEDKILEQERMLEDASHTMTRMDLMMKEQHGILVARRKELDFQTYLMNMLNMQAQEKTDSGQLTIFSLYPENIISAEGQNIHQDKPICWWAGYNGIGCVVMLSAEPDSTGQHYLVMPKMMFEQSDGQKIDVSKCVTPPEKEWPLLVDAIMGMDRHAMIETLRAGEAAAIVYATQRNPDAEKMWNDQLAAKAKREQLDRHIGQVRAAREKHDARVAKARAGQRPLSKADKGRAKEAAKRQARAVAMAKVAITDGI